MENNLIEYIARNLVDNPDEVKVVTEELPGEAVIHLQVAPGDVGQVIGKNGRIAKALRTVLGASRTIDDGSGKGVTYSRYALDIVS